MCDTGVCFTGTLFFFLVPNATSVILWTRYSHISCVCLTVKPNGIIITEELREELHQAALATTQAYAGARTASAGNKVNIECLRVGVCQTEGTYSLGVRLSVAEKRVSTGNSGGTRWRSGWGTALQAGRSRDRFLMVSLEFFIDTILLTALWPWGRLSL
jgi:hypothetical protein